MVRIILFGAYVGSYILSVKLSLVSPSTPVKKWPGGTNWRGMF